MGGDQETRRKEESSMSAFRPTQQNRYRRTFWPRRIIRTTTITTTASWPVAMIPLPRLLLVPSPLFLFPSLSSVWSTSPAINHTGSRSGSLFSMFLSHGQWAVDHGWSELLFFAAILFGIYFLFVPFLLSLIWLRVYRKGGKKRAGGRWWKTRQDKGREGRKVDSFCFFASSQLGPNQWETGAHHLPEMD